MEGTGDNTSRLGFKLKVILPRQTANTQSVLIWLKQQKMINGDNRNKEKRMTYVDPACQ